MIEIASRPVRSVFSVALVLLALSAVSAATRAAAADTPLLSGKRAAFFDRFGVAKDVATIAFEREEALVGGPSPLCPTVTELQLLSSNQTNDVVTLNCAYWRTSGKGFRYSDPTGARGGVRSVIYRPGNGRLVVKMKGEGYAALTAPVTSVDLRFAVGTASYCGRFETFRRNDAKTIRAVAPTVACTRCGNGLREKDEQCDDGNAVDGDGCDANCTATACGNGILTAGEACDDGNLAAGDGCRADCSLEVCGDGIVDAAEECDDGGSEDGDCCSAACGFESAGSACAADDDVCTDDVCDGAGRCAHPANSAPCDDENLCTINDTCANGVCAGERLTPWINEIDYDGGSTGGAPDREEFVEIAAPAGSDLSGYQVIAVEGSTACGTGLAGNGEPNLVVTLPPGTVVGDDTGTGIGFLLACFANTSLTHLLAGDCDVVLPAPSSDSNLQDGHPLNLDASTCPDGVLLLDPASGFVDAVSYEGVVPNAGTLGSFFHVTPYSAGQDQGAKLGVALEKTTSQVGRATGAAEWRLTGGCVDAGPLDSTCAEDSDSPGMANPGQSFECAAVVCGDGVVTGGEECDQGELNSNAPDATCRTDCTAQRCGDDIVDPGSGEQCERDADCPAGSACLGCGCFTGFDFTVVPGPAEGTPADDGESSWLRITPLFGITNGTRGDFNPGPLKLSRMEPGPDGKAELLLEETAFVGAHLPEAAGEGSVCFRIEQDPENPGEVDCDGGTNYDVFLTVDSGGTGEAGPMNLTVGAGTEDSGAGAGVVRVLLYGATTSDAATPCSAASYTAPPVRTAFTTATATSEITNTRQGGTTTVSLTGVAFVCGNWTSESGASIAVPNVSLDFVLPFGLGTQDVAQVLRLNDD